MDRVGEWRLIDSEESQEPKARGPEPPTDSRSDWQRLAAVVAVLVIGAVGIAIWVTLPQGGVQLDVSGQAGVVDLGPAIDRAAVAATGEAAPDLVVDVQGAVIQPGLHTLAAGTRVGDAIAAAGGYSPQVDIDAAAQRLNLAERLSDGAKIHVPERGETLPAPSGGVAEALTGSGLIDINHASESELDTLPGIGPVTAAKIIAARDQAPFATIEELGTRDVVGPATFEKIRELITATP